MTFPIQFPIAFHKWRWRSLDDLPKPKGKLAPPAVLEVQRHRYRTDLEGRPVESTLDRLLEVFHYVLSRLEPRLAKSGHA